MLSLCELRRAAGIVNASYAGHRVERFVEPGGGRIAMVLYGRAAEADSGAKRVLQLCCRPELARIGELDALPAAPQNPPAFVSYLRAHLSRARLLGADLLGDDRQLSLRLQAKEAEFELVLSILG